MEVTAAILFMSPSHKNCVYWNNMKMSYGLFLNLTFSKHFSNVLDLENVCNLAACTKFTITLDSTYFGIHFYVKVNNCFKRYAVYL